MKPPVKICGLTRPEDVEAAIRFGAAYLGFIIEAKSKRRLSVFEAAQLALPARGIIPRVAVTVNADDNLIDDIINTMQADYIQFHGDETPARIAEITSRYDVKTIKALPINTPDDVTASMTYSGFVDYLLFDAKPPTGAARGGHGMAFDWDVLNGAALPKTWFLAGGINPENVIFAAQTGAPILDVSSGTESQPGVKDHQKIEKLLSQL